MTRNMLLEGGKMDQYAELNRERKIAYSHQALLTLPFGPRKDKDGPQMPVIVLHNIE